MDTKELFRIAGHKTFFWGRSFRARFRRPYSHTFLSTDAAPWVLTEEARSLLPIYRSLDFSASIGNISSDSRQCMHFMSQFAILDPRIFGKNRIAVDYFHGMPGHEAELDRLYETFVRRKNQIDLVRVSHSEIENLLIDSGYPKERIHRIPIGIRLDLFHPPTRKERTNVRSELGFSDDHFVVGSFQKDGVGWGDGMEPKRVKGPDHFVETLRLVKDSIPGLHVLLTGPARGYVKAELEKSGIPYRHIYPSQYREIPRLFLALDCYLVSSRQEGGPKAVLESMATRVPLVTTRVGQAMDLVVHDHNGWMAEVGDVEGLAEGVRKVHESAERRQRYGDLGLATAAQESYEAQKERWRKFLVQLAEDSHA